MLAGPLSGEHPLDRLSATADFLHRLPNGIAGFAGLLRRIADLIVLPSRDARAVLLPAAVPVIAALLLAAL